MKYIIKRRDLLEIVYLLVLFLAIIYRALQNSMLSQTVELPYSISWIFILFSLLLCLFKKYNKADFYIILIVLFLLGVGIISYLKSGSMVLINALVFPFAAKGLNYRKVLKVYKWGILTSIILVFLMDVTGIISSYVYYRYGTNIFRYSFGFSHPNVFSMYILAYVFSQLFLLKYDRFQENHNITLKTLLPCILGMILTFYFSKSYTVFITLCAIFLMIVLGNHKVIYKSINKHKKMYQRLIAISALGGIAVIIYISINFTNIDFLDSLGKTAAARLYYANTGINRYGIALFGQRIDTVNSMNINLQNYNYFMVDCLYVLLLIRDGIFVSLVFWAMVISSMIKLLKNQYLIAALTCGMLMIYSILETGISFLFFGFIFTILFTDDTGENGVVKST